MKKKYLILLLSILFAGYTSIAQTTSNKEIADSTGLPGDNFSLQGALSMFKESKNLEDFEKKLNQENNYVNNLDLDADGKTDYISVYDNKENNSHAIVLQVAVSEKEKQDIAVIEIEKSNEETADLQIIGDEDIYGSKVVVEPFEETQSIEKKGPSAPGVKIVFVNVWFWPCVKFIYAPGYVVWKSPYHWHHYPPYWKPWKPYPWHMYHKHCKPHYSYFRIAPKHRVVNAHQVYLPHRTTSSTVYGRNKPALQQHRAANKTPNTVKPQRVTRYKSNAVRTTPSKAPTRSGGGNKGNTSRGNSGGKSGHRK